MIFRREFLIWFNFIIAGFFVRSGSCQFLWDRIFSTASPHLPQDCTKRWGRCLYAGPDPYSQFGAYYEEEVVVVPARNGGSCSLNIRRYCDAFCNTPPPCKFEKRDCIKKWSACFGSGANSYRIEIEVQPAQNGGKCELGYEFECDATAVDCEKNWGECTGNGPTSERREMMVKPAKNGGKCQLRRETGCRYQPVNCVKKWGKCEGVWEESSRSEVVVEKEMYGGTCKIRTEKECNTPPRDCTKRWGPCVGQGPRSFREEKVVRKEKYGGVCRLGKEFGCNVKPINCKKKWGECKGNGPTSELTEVVVEPAKHGGKCRLRKETGCRYRPVNCVKKWGECEGVGEDSSRTEVLVKKELYGGVCNLKIEKECNTPPRDCTKRWGSCVGLGPSSYREEEVVAREKYGGVCKLRKEYGCKEEQNPSNEDSPGKKVASLLIANFVVDAVDAPAAKPSGPAGARSLTFQFRVLPPPQSDKAQTDNSSKKNCTEFKDGDRIIAVGCDDADDIDPNIIAEERRLKIRGGEKQRNTDSTRTKRSTEVAKIPTPRDVLFLLDSSGSVGPYHFDVLKDVCKAIVDVLCGRISLGKYQTRIAMATFNRRQLLSFPFSKTSDTAVVKKQIDNVKFDYVYSFQSCIKDALQYVLTDIYLEKNGARDPSYAEGDMFIMTDGCANCDYSENNKELQRMAYRLKLNKINVYAIGIGIEENCRNILKVLARGGRCFHFFYLDNWDVDVRDFLNELQNPKKVQCLDKFEFPGINCLEDRQG